MGTFDEDTDIPNADYPVPAARNGIHEGSEKLENGANDSDTDTLHGDDAPENAQEISNIAKGESGEASYLSMFGATNGSNQEDDIADIKEEITESNLDALPSTEEAKADDDDLV